MIIYAYFYICICMGMSTGNVTHDSASVPRGGDRESSLSPLDVCSARYAVASPSAVCCSVLQCVAVCCSVMQGDAVCCSVLQCVAV